MSSSQNHSLLLQSDHTLEILLTMTHDVIDAGVTPSQSHRLRSRIRDAMMRRAQRAYNARLLSPEDIEWENSYTWQERKDLNAEYQELVSQMASARTREIDEPGPSTESQETSAQSQLKLLREKTISLLRLSLSEDISHTVRCLIFDVGVADRLLDGTEQDKQASKLAERFQELEAEANKDTTEQAGQNSLAVQSLSGGQGDDSVFGVEVDSQGEGRDK